MPDSIQKDEPWMKVYYLGHGQWRVRFLVGEPDSTQGWTESRAVGRTGLGELIAFIAGKYESYWVTHRVPHDAD
jgi:hypothetical protein